MVSVFLIICVLNSMYTMIICITYSWMVQASMVIKYSEKHHVISDISINLTCTRISNQFSTCVNYLAHLSYYFSRFIPCWIYFLKNISCWVVLRPFVKWFQQCYVSGGFWASIVMFRVDHEYVSGGSRVCFGWITMQMVAF